ncbi:hypothetical protein HPB47_026784 [Ixodes persulcatus]|uniref:Uncharacterized protein n=1 Tax=Ixodes persulcatus TaxID=34615 RepID=A0AC60PXT1_IXOPE|nr:hypothetical protein HPB47_026784 [Ixodes persulcatus]
MLVRLVFQPRPVYQAQCQRFTKAEWARLKTLNGEPYGSLRESPVSHRFRHFRLARALKIGVVPAAVALVCYMTPSVPLVDPPEALLPPWRHCQVTDNKLLGCFRQTHRSAPATDLTVLPPPASTPSDADLVSYVDARLTASQLYAGLAELVALRDGLTALLPVIAARRPLRYTDSLQAVRTILWLQIFIVLWRNAPARFKSAGFAGLVSSLTPRQTQPVNLGRIHKETLQRTTRTLIPPCGSDLPGGLTRLEEVSLRRVQVNAATKPAVRAGGVTPRPPPAVLSAPTHPERRISQTHSGHYQRWTHDSHHRCLLDFFQET